MCVAVTLDVLVKEWNGGVMTHAWQGQDFTSPPVRILAHPAVITGNTRFMANTPAGKKDFQWRKHLVYMAHCLVVFDGLTVDMACKQVHKIAAACLQLGNATAGMMGSANSVTANLSSLAKKDKEYVPKIWKAAHQLKCMRPDLLILTSKAYEKAVGECFVAVGRHVNDLFNVPLTDSLSGVFKHLQPDVGRQPLPPSVVGLDVGTGNQQAAPSNANMEAEEPQQQAAAPGPAVAMGQGGEVVEEPMPAGGSQGGLADVHSGH